MFETINNDLMKSLKNGDKFKLSVLRMLKSALQLDAISKKRSLEDEEVVSVIKKQIKQRNDSIVEYEKYNQDDKVADLQKEVQILSIYLPEEISEEELHNIINMAFSKTNPTSIKDMGLVMKETTNLLKGKNADMSKVSKIIKERLS